MAATLLVSPDVTLGKQVFAAIEHDDILRPIAAMWLFDTNANEWRFLIATPDFVRRGPKAAYLRIRNVLKKSGLLERLPLRHVTLTQPDDPLIQAMGQSVEVTHSPGKEPSDVTFQDCSFNGIHVTAACVIYLKVR